MKQAEKKRISYLNLSIFLTFQNVQLCEKIKA